MACFFIFFGFLFLFPTSTGRQLLTKRESRLSVAGESAVEGWLGMRRLTFNHFAKCGGTQIKSLILASMTNSSKTDTMVDIHQSSEIYHSHAGDTTNKSLLTYLNIESEHTVLKESERNDFIIGTTRNPFDWYVSLWAFTSGPFHQDQHFRKALTKKQQADVLGRADPLGSTPDDLDRFRKFLRIVSGKDLGLMSFRFYAKYMDLEKASDGAEHRSVWRHWHKTLARDVTSRHENCTRRMHQIFARGVTPVTCWVHTENLVSDTEACLKRYRAGIRNKAVVNMTALDQVATEVVINHTPHVACDSFYDKETRELVLHSDRHLFSLFKYPAKCSSNK